MKYNERLIELNKIDTLLVDKVKDLHVINNQLERNEKSVEEYYDFDKNILIIDNIAKEIKENVQNFDELDDIKQEFKSSTVVKNIIAELHKVEFLIVNGNETTKTKKIQINEKIIKQFYSKINQEKVADEIIKAYHTKEYKKCIMLGISYMERIICELISMKSKTIYYKLRENIMTKEFDTLFSNNLGIIIRCYAGSLESLNVRNLLFHGFLKGDEVQEAYAKFVLILIQTLANYELIKNTETLQLWKVETYTTNHECKETIHKNFNYIKSWNQKNPLENFIFEGSYYDPNRLETYKLMNEAIKQKKYYDFLLYYFPEMEHLIRRLFVIMNNDINRVYPATTVLYTTLDEILDPNIDENENQLYKELTKNQILLLMDLTTWRHGIRLRDLISHGFISYESDLEVYSYYAIIIMESIASLFTKAPSELQKACFEFTETQYEPLYHPKCILFKKMRDLDKINYFSEFKRKPEWTEFELTKSRKKSIFNQYKESIKQTISTLKKIPFKKDYELPIKYQGKLGHMNSPLINQWIVFEKLLDIMIHLPQDFEIAMTDLMEKRVGNSIQRKQQIIEKLMDSAEDIQLVISLLFTTIKILLKTDIDLQLDIREKSMGLGFSLHTALSSTVNFAKTEKLLKDYLRSISTFLKTSYPNL